MAPASIARATSARIESSCAGVGAAAVGPMHRSAHRALADVDGGVRADAVLRPAVELRADVDRAAAVVVGDDRRDALHQIRQIGLALRVREVAGGVRVRIDEARRDDEARGVDRSRCRDAAGGRIADEHDAVAANADVGAASAGARAVDDGSAANEKVDPLLRRRRAQRGEWRRSRLARGREMSSQTMSDPARNSRGAGDKTQLRDGGRHPPRAHSSHTHYL